MAYKPVGADENGKFPARVQNALSDTFGGSVNAKAFGAKGDKVTDDTAAIQAAIDSLAATGGTVLLPPGEYKTTATIALNASNVTLAGYGGAILAPQLPLYAYGIKATGTRTAGVTTLSVSASKAARTITVASAAGLAAGNAIVIRSASEVYSTERPTVYVKAEHATIASIAGTVVTLKTPLRDSYSTTAATVHIDKLNMVKGVTVRDLTIRMGGTGLAQSAAGFHYASDVRVENVRVEKSARQGIMALGCTEVTVSSCYVEDADEQGLAYGILFDGVHGGSIIGCQGVRNRHSIEITGSTPQPPSRDISVLGNAVTSDISAGISTHGGAEAISIVGNTVSGCGGGIVTRGAQTIIEANTIITAPNGNAESYHTPIVVGDSGAHPWGTGRGGEDLVIKGNTIRYVSGGDVAAVHGINITAPLLNCIIQGNVIAGWTGHGIYAQGSYNNGALISGNIIDGRGCTGPAGNPNNGILIIPKAQTADSVTQNLTISGNLFLNVLLAALQITGPNTAGNPARDITISGNTIHSRQRGITASASGFYSNLAVRDNTFLGADVTPANIISIAGAALVGPVLNLNNSINGATPENIWGAKQTFTAAPVLANNVALNGLTTGGTAVPMALLSSGGSIYIGDALAQVSNISVIFRSGTGGSMLRFRANNTDQILVNETGVGFFNKQPVARPALTYSKTGESAPEAQLRAALVALGLVTDSTVA